MKKKDTFVKILPVIIIILIVIMAVIALMSLGKAIFKNGGKKEPQVNALEQALLATDASRGVKMTVRGPIVAQENFRSYQIVITPSSRIITTYKGYLGEQISTKQLDNNLPAYEQFVNSLVKANLSKSKPFETENLNGICATGTVTEFDVLQNNKSLAHIWTSTCKGSVGSLAASVDQNKNLFLSQIPEYGKILSAAGIR
jgi:hypothetical protein